MLTFEKLCYSKKELASALAVSPQTVMSEVRKGRIQPTRIGRRILFSSEEVKRYIRARTERNDVYA